MTKRGRFESPIEENPFAVCPYVRNECENSVSLQKSIMLININDITPTGIFAFLPFFLFSMQSSNIREHKRLLHLQSSYQNDTFSVKRERSCAKCGQWNCQKNGPWQAGSLVQDNCLFSQKQLQGRGLFTSNNKIIEINSCSSIDLNAKLNP